jgi:hypothetical protein
MEQRKRPVPVVFNVRVDREPTPTQRAAETVRTIAGGGSVKFVIEPRERAQRVKVKNIADRLKRAKTRGRKAWWRSEPDKTYAQMRAERKKLKEDLLNQGLYRLGIKSWLELQDALMAGDERYALKLLKVELNSHARRSWAIRIYQRFHLLRGDRERQLIWDQCESKINSKFRKATSSDDD